MICLRYKPHQSTYKVSHNLLNCIRFVFTSKTLTEKRLRGMSRSNYLKWVRLRQSAFCRTNNRHSHSLTSTNASLPSNYGQPDGRFSPWFSHRAALRSHNNWNAKRMRAHYCLLASPTPTRLSASNSSGVFAHFFQRYTHTHRVDRRLRS